MKKSIELLLIIFVFTACGTETDKYTNKQANWEDKKAAVENFDGYNLGKTYLPVYSYIYHVFEHRTFDLTTTVSIRNISVTDSVYILKADYFNTVGENIRQYIKYPIFLGPLETVEIIIEEQDVEGGSGANFIFDWATVNDKNPPLFEAVMISTYGQQGLSFTTRGVRIVE
ncbi:DUF3124 domain-containing protein [Saccharicrinis sp. 156]|uniref:DUF3124 domain-containing protein n=1 Tax=Saccharicrinis sp. 156 TaxID=3417574 RepID=UPI003D3285AC